MDSNKEYFAFISYKGEDYEMAKWLQYKLEHYHLPSIIRKEHPDLPQKIRPIFEYKSEMAGGFLKPEIKQALSESKYLIVICSPNTPQSQWVADEIQSFIDEGRVNRIIPFVVAGEAYSKDPTKECFPVPLRELKEPLRGISIDELGRDAAAVKVVAQMFGLKFDVLWQRYEKEKKRKRRFVGYGVGVFALVAMAIAGWMVHKDWEMMKIQARAVSEQVNNLVAEGDSYTARIVALEVMPKDWAWKYWPNRPYVSEVEVALRNSVERETGVFKGIKATVSPDGNRIAALSIDGRIMVYNVRNGALEYCSDVETSFSHYGIDSRDISPNESDAIVFQPHMNLSSMEFSPDGSMLACIVKTKR